MTLIAALFTLYKGFRYWGQTWFCFPLSPLPRCPRVSPESWSVVMGRGKCLSLDWLLQQVNCSQCRSSLKPWRFLVPKSDRRELWGWLFTTRWHGPSSFAGEVHLPGEMWSPSGPTPLSSFAFAVALFSNSAGVLWDWEVRGQLLAGAEPGSCLAVCFMPKKLCDTWVLCLRGTCTLLCGTGGTLAFAL